ncbi:Anaphase-promoting complex subunit 11, partial [Mucuna pruriens]
MCVRVLGSIKWIHQYLPEMWSLQSATGAPPPFAQPFSLLPHGAPLLTDASKQIENEQMFFLIKMACCYFVDSGSQDETCGICRMMTFDGCCPDCELPGDDCPLSKLLIRLYGNCHD